MVVCKVGNKRLAKQKLQSDMCSVRNTSLIRFFIHRIHRSAEGNLGKDVRHGRTRLVSMVHLLPVQFMLGMCVPL